ncbi:MAG TPA: uroporphyrinogen decarboxylase [Bacteroidales bacterium]|nr:uroporphyrinogen decarboxylase [Bacteroidales bacterium]
MRDEHWRSLLKIINGEVVTPIPAGFIIDCPWLPNWAGVTMSDYFTHEETWFQCHSRAAEVFPDIIFLPGYWSEFGMCTEPSAFGARCSFPVNEFPHAHRVIHSSEEIDRLGKPNPETDGFLPFMLNRLVKYRSQIEKAGQQIRFSVSRGPLNIASYLMGTTEFLMLILMEPARAHQLIRLITDFLMEWHDLQKKRIDSIDGIFMLDDLIGFMSKDQFEEFGLPYFKELYSRPLSVRFLHNDAPCRESAPLLNAMGINLFNMGTDVTLNELRELTGPGITLMGNIPPRDVLAALRPEQVELAAREMISQLNSPMRILPSCGGGMPPGVSSDNLNAFLRGITRI